MAASTGTTIPPVACAQGTAYEQLQAFSGVLSHARLNYVDSVDFSSLVQAAIRGMLRSLDPHSRYVTRREFDLQAQWDRGELAGPGLTLENADRIVTVLAVAPDGPAAKAGVQSGDRVLRLNDTTIAGVNADAVELRMLGEKGSKLRLVLERGNRLTPDTLSVSLKRTALEHQVVSAPRIVGPAIGYLRLFEFTPLAPDEVRKGIKKLRGQGAKQLILDLRGNPGGDMEAMASIASLFLPDRAEVFHTQSRKRTGLDSVFTGSKGDFAELPLILLIDAGSASASEMLAGSLQDHDRALIVGRRSFGKALMQSSLPLPNGDLVWMTTARVVTPSGRIIQRSYQGLGGEQYEELAGQAGSPEDTLRVYRTDRGRAVRGGGGILPDVVRPGSAELPVWFSVAVDSGYDSVADSVGNILAREPQARVAWATDSSAWQGRLVTPFLARIESRLRVRVTPGSVLRAKIGLLLARRAAFVAWGSEAAEDLAIRNDVDIQAALAYFPRLQGLLGVPPGK